ncbi:diguanylate cyclase [Clostridium sp. JS66]|uniref:sensor domain-containing diguanylate cyclase n=1 Tax=Clostridium sp. JS66 TaxID=3064705 RepID=UPI00298DC985|nr:diguanylate cyclase [Clostridium sp. JS66]WPC43607.1 diguanylate cyclase [Clostridium sp. JS66]
MRKIISITILVLFVSICLFLNAYKASNVKASESICNLNNYNFTKIGTDKLTDQWKLSNNTMLEPLDLKYKNTDKFKVVQDNLKAQAYTYFILKDEIADKVIQISNDKDPFIEIKPMEFGFKDQIMNEFIFHSGIDFIIIGGLFILELLFIFLYKRLKKDNAFLYFFMLCLLVQMRCLFLNEWLIKIVFPNMPNVEIIKIQAFTYYPWISIYILFLNEWFTNLSKKIIASSLIFSSISIIMLFITNDKLLFFNEAILLIIMISVLIFLINKVRKKEKNSEISLIAFLFLLITTINDMLVDNCIKGGGYSFQIGIFIFAFLETYVVITNYSNEIIKLENLRMQNKIIYEKSIRDDLTNLYSRNYIVSILDTMIEIYIKQGKKFTTLMFDIDYFKSINDTYGHLCGDEVLVAVSSVLKKNLRSTDYIGRYGGEEFIVVLPDTQKEKAKEIAERIRKGVANLSWKQKINVTISGGVYENEVYTKYECIKIVDKLLYMAKANGRNRIETKI